MRLLILGGKGMAGSIMVSYFKRQSRYEVFFTSRDPGEKNGIFLDIRDFRQLGDLIAVMKPDFIINCIGILNDRAAADPLHAFRINSLLPRLAARFVERNQGKLVHISTDCVFSGHKGDYTEDDIPDGTSVYAESKQLGEMMDGKHLTIRTSIIGPELKDDGIGLFLWFMKQAGEVKGYQKVLWNGVTTLELAKAVEAMILHNVSGLYHLGAEPKISKYALLKLIQEVFNKKDVNLLPDSSIVLDRTIVHTRTDFTYPIPSYEEMLTQLKDWMGNP